ncbi:hypothetical protein KAU33_01015, partial [Candidatus Dependentiae bacterium]|nr:hypothetical protein [Candidatus Dependentiae bacterium]
DEPFKVIIEKPSGEKIYEKVLKTNEFGSVNDTVELGENAELGWYKYKVLTSKGKTITQYYQRNAFRVEEYKKPEFKMTVTPEKSSYVVGDEIEVAVDVKYYFGEAVKNGDVEYRIEYAQHYVPYWYYYPFSWYYGDNNSYGYNRYRQFYKEGKAKTDSNGKGTIRFKAKDLKYNANYTVRVRVTDKSRRMIEGSTSVKVAQAQFSITMTTDKYVYKPGNKVKLNFKGKDIVGKPVPFKGEIKITKYVWRNKKSEYIDILTEKIKTLENGQGIYEFEPDEKGNFYATITAKDKNGRTVTAQRSFYVADYSYREHFNFSSVDIIMDKDFYDIGDKVSAVIQSPFKEGWGLLTYEADGLLGYKVVKLTSSSTVIDFDIKEYHSPNFYVSITVIKDNKIYTKLKNVIVPPKKKFLDIKISSDKSTYKPGEEAEFKITVKDGNGKPVICELSMGIVDASLYYIQEEFVKDMRQFYYNRIWNQVRTSNSFYMYYRGRKRMSKGVDKNATADAMPPPSPSPEAELKVSTFYAAGEEIVDGMVTKKEKEPKIREYFPDTAYWNPVILTDMDGVATVKIKVPDTLTTWRTTIRGISKSTQVGMSKYEFTTFKPLLVRLQLPRFITQDDRLLVSGIVHNYLKTEKSVRSTLTATGVTLKTGSSQTHNIKPGDDYRFDWKIIAENSGEAEFILKGLTDEESDGMKLSIPILPHGLKRFDNQTGVLKKPEEKIIKTVFIPETAIMEASELQVFTSGSLAGTMFDSLEYLIGFPYGCVEQTMSRFLPTIMVAQTIQKLGLEQPEVLEKIPEMVEKGFKMLYDMQHHDGGWGWWTNDNTHPYMTAYVVYGLAMAIEADYKVDMNRYRNGVKSLEEQFEKQKPCDQKAYMAYVMSHLKKPDKKGIIKLYKDRDKLSIYGKSLLAMAMFNIDEKSKGEAIVKFIKSKAKCTELFCHFEGETFKYSWRRNDLAVSTYAFKAIVMANPDDELVPKIINWLLLKRTGNYWVSTKDTANVVYAFSYYLDKSGELDADYSYKVYVNNRQELNGKITKKNILKPGRNITIKAQKLNVGENKIEIIKSGKGRLYFTLALNYFNYEKVIKAESKNIKVKRTYSIVKTQRDKNGNMKETFSPLKEVVRSGQEIEVTLEVSSNDPLEYIMIEDYIPAGCEIIDRKSGKSWYSHKEFRDEKAVFFITHFYWYRTRQTKIIKYRLRAEIPGDFEVLPTIATSMYFPDVYANTKSDRLTIVE